MSKNIKKIVDIKITNKIIEDETAINFLSKGKLPLRHFLQGVKKLSESNNYDIVFINISRIQEMGWAIIQEIRRNLLSLRKDNVLILAFLESGGIKEYYLASVADEIILSPAGILDLVGLQAEVFFMKGALDHLGVEAEIIKTGDYKTAGDMFTRESMSEPHRNILNSILDNFIEEISDGIADSRHKLNDRFDKILNRGPFTANEALDIKLVDHIMYEEEVENYLEKRFNVKKCIRMPFKPVVSKGFFSNLSIPSKKIALIYASGNIIEGEKRGFAPSYGYITSKDLVRDVRKARKSKSVKAVVIRVNSPGGSALASDIIWHEIRKTTEKKPVIISMSNVAASGGYYISMGASCIFAESMTITGSIGVISGKFYSKTLLNKIGINRDVVVKGDKADMYSITRPFTKDELGKVENQVFNFYYKQFVEKAANGRKTDYNTLESYAQGKIWTGNQGKLNGLVDKLGGLLESVDEAKNIAKIDLKTSVKLAIYPKRKFKLSLRNLIHEAFYSMILKDSIFEMATPVPVKELIDMKMLIGRLDALYMMPSVLNIN
ncbi:MAG: signal peptide peptidase SppA [Spirochaetota bacterium]|nr:signal peptide peptidase SppA [Spirochaetota bacterium]